MHAFESIVATILRCNGWWVENAVRVPLTKEEKRRVGKPSMASYELDIVAYKGAINKLWVVECKSFLDSPGVRAAAFEDADSPTARLYKLFNDEMLWDTVQDRLKQWLTGMGRCRTGVRVQLCLAAGKLASDNDRTRIAEFFKIKGWHLMDDRWIAMEMKRLSATGYADNEAIMATKLLARFKDPDALA